MLKEYTPIFRKSLLSLDLLCTVASFMGAIVILNSFEGLTALDEAFSWPFLSALLVGIVFLWSWLLLKHPQYGQFRGLRLYEILWPAIRVVGLGTLILGFWLVFVELGRSGRATFLLSFGGGQSFGLGRVACGDLVDLGGPPLSWL